MNELEGIEIEKLKKIENEIRVCSKCSLSKTRKFPVAGEGNANTTIMLIGLGPGYNENEQGKPFVGVAGKFLNELLGLARLKREEVYITNVIKCYLPNNIATQEQIDACSPYLDKQIAVIKPRIIFALGNVATSYIFQKFKLKLESIGRIHAQIFQISNLLLQAKIIPMYHPASALYNSMMKEILKEDWKKIKMLFKKF